MFEKTKNKRKRGRGGPIKKFKIFVPLIMPLFHFYRVLDGGLTAAAVLISLGAVLGKLNPLQVLVMSLVETGAFVLNAYIGYKVLGAVDVGENIRNLCHSPFIVKLVSL